MESSGGGGGRGGRESEVGALSRRRWEMGGGRGMEGRMKSREGLVGGIGCGGGRGAVGEGGCEWTRGDGRRGSRIWKERGGGWDGGAGSGGNRERGVEHV